MLDVIIPVTFIEDVMYVKMFKCVGLFDIRSWFGKYLIRMEFRCSNYKVNKQGSEV